MRRCAHPELVEEFQKNLNGLARVDPYIDQETRKAIVDALDTAYDMIFPPEPSVSECTKGCLLWFRDWIHER